ncbi:ATP-binding protein [Candidatus Uabimicrobium sp. HlEnr_7]|uniref:DNA polymerase III subunit n=1 Tax=Candidatus Uabimicrobium helgolandensis TaxID=3095367 RepID=UPI0035563E21
MESTLSCEEIVDYFCENVKQEKVFHASLLVGSDSLLLEKTSANIIEKIFCPLESNSTTKQKIAEKIHPDVMEVSAGDKKNISIDKIRNVIQNASIKPWEAKYRIFVILNIERMSIEAANSLLKVLEEPPAHALFLLTAENIYSVPDTILSRCQIFKLNSLGIRRTYEELVNTHQIPLHRAQVAAQLADGNLQSALLVLENDWKVRDSLIQIVLRNRDPLSISAAIMAFCKSGEEGRQQTKKWITFLSSVVRDMMLIKSYTEIESSQIINSDFFGELQRSTFSCTYYEIASFLDFLLKCLHMTERNVSVGLIWENICMFLHNN